MLAATTVLGCGAPCRELAQKEGACAKAKVPSVCVAAVRQAVASGNRAACGAALEHGELFE